MRNEKGQVILILLLVMAVALVIGLSVIQRSLTDITTSFKVEQSSRAFSAAEAGIERALTGNTAGANFSENNSSATVLGGEQLPLPNQALEYPPVSKEEIIQVWLAKPDDLSNPYDGNNLDIYWGNPNVSGADKPAVAITVIYQSNGLGSPYKNKKYFFDTEKDSRNNGFTLPASCAHSPITTSLSPTTAKSFYCKQTIDVGLSGIADLGKLILLRSRLLYTSISQSFAIAPALNKSLPMQAVLFTSIGISGDTQRKLQLFKLDRVVPFYFDYAIFSAGEINK